MTDYFIYYLLCTLISYSILRVVFGSALFSLYREIIATQIYNAAVGKKKYRYFVLYMLRCWQCSGYWCAFAVTAAAGLLFHFLPVSWEGAGQWFLISLAVAVTTDVLAEYIPLTVAELDMQNELDERIDNGGENELSS